MFLRKPISASMGMRWASYATLLSLSLNACGEASFNAAGVARPDQSPNDTNKSGDATPIDPNPDPTDPGTPDPVDPTPQPSPTGGASSTRFDSLLWFFQCESAPAAVPNPRTDKDVVAVGSSQQKHAREDVDGIPVTITGKVCPAVTKRDIVFVIDVSGSMNTNDPPRADGKCGRYDAVMAVVGSIAPGTSVQFGGVTFHSSVAQKSAAFVTEPSLMFGSQNLASIVCAVGGNTNYGASLQAALSLINTARADASQEVYLISDGRPEDGSGNGTTNAAINGVAEAASIRNKSVTLATIMLGADQVGNAHMKDKIAGTNGAGEKMHENVIDASKLANALRDLAANDVKAGQIMYRPVGANDWSSFDMTKYRTGDSFTLPSFPLDLNAAPEGLEVKFTYEDKRGKTFSGQGTLSFGAE